MATDQRETVAVILATHRTDRMTPAQTIARCYQRIREYDDPAVFISLRDESDAIAQSEKLASRKDAAHLALYGMPVAVKDNIDALGFPTTARCPSMPSLRRCRSALSSWPMAAAWGFIVAAALIHDKSLTSPSGLFQ